MVSRSSTSRISIVHVFPTVLGLYGDRGNALVLAHRAQARGIAVELLTVDPGQSVPRLADVYLLGGGEDLAQTKATELLHADGGLAAAIRSGTVMLAVCAGLQILGTEFPAAAARVPGLGLIDAATTLGAMRAVGELLTEPDALDIPVLTGYENHAGRTTLGADTTPLGRVVRGVGNGMAVGHTGQHVPPSVDGYVAGHVIGTYLHGPVLARNPALADLLLMWATGEQMTPVDDSRINALRSERLSSVLDRHARSARTPRPSGSLRDRNHRPESSRTGACAPLQQDC
jgi:CobQ-like glutamine amidotransferase family enzyme